VSLSEEQFREQLVDYLYGELDDTQRAAFEAELAASPARRAELDALRATLRTARTGLASLEEEPPARLRGVILDAERASYRVVQRKPWYRRGVTVAPLLAAAAALTFAVLAPRPEHQPGPDYASEPAALPTPREAAPTSPTREEDAPGVGELARAPVESKGKLEASEKKRELRSRSAARRGPAAEENIAERADDRAAQGEGFAQPPAGWGSGTLGGSGGGGLRLEPHADKAASRAPSPRAPAPRASAPASESAVSESAVSEAAPAPVASRPAPAPAKTSADAEPREQARPEAAAPRAPDEQVKRAQEHMAARRWSQAVIAYRELLQRFPRDERAARWRSELGEAARALSAVPLTP
jgi:hypothetical protein